MSELRELLEAYSRYGAIDMVISSQASYVTSNDARDEEGSEIRLREKSVMSPRARSILIGRDKDDDMTRSFVEMRRAEIKNSAITSRCGYIFAPYILAFTTATIMLDDFIGRKGIASRYGKKAIDGNFFCNGTITT